MKKIASLLLCLLLLAACALPVLADEGYPPVTDEEITAKAIYLYNMDTDSMIYAKNSHEPMYPASLTKIMTCILALEYIEDMNLDLDRETITYPLYVQNELYEYRLAHGAISTAGDLRAGEELTMRQALYAIMLPSANEVAMSIADHIGGSQEGFVKMMNERAVELGCQSTNFVNANGLFDEKHVTTAYDMAQITKHALTMPEFVKITSTTVHQSGPTTNHDNITWNTTNEMMVAPAEGNIAGTWEPNNPRSGNYYYSSVKGVKTGTLPQSGRCFISTASKDGFTYLLVVMGSQYEDENGTPLRINMAFVDTGQIYDWVFRTFRLRMLEDRKYHVENVPLRLSSEKDTLKLVTAEKVTALLPDSVTDDDIIRTFHIPEYVNAPVEKDEVIGELVFSFAGEELGRVDLLAQESVEASPVLVLLAQAQEITRSFWFKFILIFLVLLLILFLVLKILRRRRRSSAYRPKRRI